MLMGNKEIQEILPHRHPFLLVDYIEELEPGVRAVGYKCVTFNEPYFRGHFPENPVMPGVLIIEALAQVGSVAMLSLDAYKGKTGYFGGINNCKFKHMVRPATSCAWSARLSSRRARSVSEKLWLRWTER